MIFIKLSPPATARSVAYQLFLLLAIIMWTVFVKIKSTLYPIKILTLTDEEAFFRTLKFIFRTALQACANLSFAG